MDKSLRNTLRHLGARTRMGSARGSQSWASALSGRWQHRWCGRRPVAQELRDGLNENWVRFHSLPDSKRYAETDDEYATLLGRHHTVLTDLTGLSPEPSTGRVVAVTCAWSKDPTPVPRPPDVAAAAPRAVLWQTIRLDGHADSPTWLHLYASRHRPTPRSLDPLLRLAAIDRNPGVIIADEQLTWLYHPYDGGADVIAPTPAARDELKDKHKSWLSAHPTGL